MKANVQCECTKTKWKGRSGWRLTNGVLELIVLIGGGHLASLRRTNPESPNVIWEAPWTTIEPTAFSNAKHSKLYGAAPVGMFLSGYTGHSDVLGYFGMPSDAESSCGLPLHGEIGCSTWRPVSHTQPRQSATLAMEAHSPAMGLRLVRELTMNAGESCVQIRETITNMRECDTYYQWVQHATFGEPLLTRDDGIVTIPAVRACTWSLGYEGKPLLPDNKEFRWPVAPLRSGGIADLSRGFIREGTGFIVASLIEPSRAHGFVAIANQRLRLAAGYSFPRSVYPWVTLWEENAAREYAPWNQITRARGLEFGTSPFPLGLAQAINSGPMFDTPTVARIGAKQSVSVKYQLFATAIPPEWRSVSDVRITAAGLEMLGSGGREPLLLGKVAETESKVRPGTRARRT